jgi:hypothetical protein
VRCQLLQFRQTILQLECISALSLAPYILIKAEKVFERFAAPSTVAEFDKLEFTVLAISK